MTRIVAYRVGNPTSVVRPADTVNHGCATNLWLKHFLLPSLAKRGWGRFAGEKRSSCFYCKSPLPPLSKGGISLCKEYGTHIFVADP